MEVVEVCCFGLVCLFWLVKIFSWIDPGSRHRMSADEAGSDNPFPSVHLHVPMPLFLKERSPLSSVCVPLVLISGDNSAALQQSRKFKISSFFSQTSGVFQCPWDCFVFPSAFSNIYFYFWFFFAAASRSLESWKSDVGVMSPIFALSTGRAPTGSLRWFQFLLSSLCARKNISSSWLTFLLIFFLVFTWLLSLWTSATQ